MTRSWECKRNSFVSKPRRRVALRGENNSSLNSCGEDYYSITILVSGVKKSPFHILCPCTNLQVRPFLDCEQVWCVSWEMIIYNCLDIKKTPEPQIPGFKRYKTTNTTKRCLRTRLAKRWQRPAEQPPKRTPKQSPKRSTKIPLKWRYWNSLIYILSQTRVTTQKLDHS